MIAVRGMVMALVAASAAAACGDPHDGQPCSSNADCGKDVCSRFETCDAADDLKSAEIDWTINNAPAINAVCDGHLLNLEFDGDGVDSEVFAPVPCNEGKFSIDLLPSSYDHAQLYDLYSPASDGGRLGDSPLSLNLDF